MVDGGVEWGWVGVEDAWEVEAWWLRRACIQWADLDLGYSITLARRLSWGGMARDMSDF